MYVFVDPMCPHSKKYIKNYTPGKHENLLDNVACGIFEALRIEKGTVRDQKFPCQGILYFISFKVCCPTSFAKCTQMVFRICLLLYSLLSGYHKITLIVNFLKVFVRGKVYTELSSCDCCNFQ